MKILYVAPRYHLNQVPIMEGWLKAGHEICFISQGTNASEDHAALQPVILGYSGCFNLFLHICKLLNKGLRDDEDKAFAFRSKRGFPPIMKMEKIVRAFGPEVAILRERSLYTIVSYAICRSLGIPCILYNQSPLFDEKENVKKSNFLKRTVRSLCPKTRMTPIKQPTDPFYNESELSYYVPFVMPAHTTTDEKKHFAEGFMHIICVAGYHDRKQIPLLLNAVRVLKEKYPIRLVVAGEVISEGQKQYYSQMTALCKQLGIETITELKKNVSRTEVFELYKNADLFVLPSTRERASISQLEAMSCAIPIICSHTNGSACMIREAENGYCFKDLNPEDLIAVMDRALSDRNRLVEMGESSLRYIHEEYSFRNYQRCLERIMEHQI